MIKTLRTQAKSLYFIYGLLLFGFITLTVVVLGVWLSRGDWVYPEQLQFAKSTASQPNNASIGQSFVARQAGLQAFRVRIPPLETTQTFTFALKESPAAARAIRQATIVAQPSARDQWISFAFDPLPDSRTRYYYASIKAASAKFYYGPPEIYLDGAMYLNAQPQEGQLTFMLAYNRPLMLLDLLKGMALSLPRGIVVLLAFLLPGWAFWTLTFRAKTPCFTLHWVEGMSVAFGFSLAFYPILFLFTYALGLRLGAWYMWGSIVVSAAVLGRHYRPWQLKRRALLAKLKIWTASDTFWADIAVMSLLFLALGGRFLMVRGLDMPLWDDSAHHVVITKRIMESGGLFQEWMPYAPYKTFSFHFGFHVNSAVFGWATGLDAPQAVLWGGQFFNLLAVFALYPLAYRLKGAWTGAIALLVAGFFTQFPLYYTNWGRYPQLMGQIVLLFAAWWTWITLSPDGQLVRNKLWFLGGAALIAGSLLGYYRMAFHYLAFVAAIFLIALLPYDEFLRRRRQWMVLLGVVALAGLIMSPWIGQLLSRFLLPAGQAAASAGSGQSITIWDKIESLYVQLPMKQLLVFALGVFSIVWWGKRAALPAGWMLTLLLLPVLTTFPIPGVKIIQQFTIETSLYIPLTLIWAVFGGFLLAEQLAKRWQLAAMFSFLLIAAALYKFPEIPATIDRDFDLSGRPDLLAAEWINQNVSEDAFFLINGIVYTDGYSAIAGDAGTWLSIWTKRGITIPPQYALLAEVPNEAGYSEAVNNLTSQLFEIFPTTAPGKKIICNFPTPITHVYLGQRRGTVDKAITPPPRPMLPAKALLRDPAFKLIHQQDRAMIFEFDRAVCNE